MQHEISRFEIVNELDIVLAHKRATQICDFTGVNITDQTRFATAISEICRNCLEFASGGSIIFSIVKNMAAYHIEVRIIDNGKGIDNLPDVLSGKYSLPNGRGKGISYSRKLVDNFTIESGKSGTRVTLCQKVPSKHPPMNSIIINGWKQHFQKEMSVSPYEEMKKRNTQLLQFAEELSKKKTEAEYQLKENERLMKVLERNNETLKEFAFAISHDLRTPLTTLKLWADMAAATDDMGKKDSFIRKVNSSVKRLNNTIMGLVQIIDVQKSTSESGDMLSFAEIVHNVESEYQAHLDKIKGSIITHFEEEEIVYIDAYLQSILTNLISNCIKYHSAERELEIRISTRRENGFVLLEVEDNGSGMDLEKTLPSLFKPFTRFTAQSEGRGIGLHIIKSMIEKNNGRIEVKSQPKRGTTFTCYLCEYEMREVREGSEQEKYS